MIGLLFSLTSLAVAEAETHTVQLIEVGTDLPVVAEVRCGEQRIQSTIEGLLTLDVSCAKVQIISAYHHPLELSASAFQNSRPFLCNLSNNKKQS